MSEMCWLVTDSMWTVQRILFRAQGIEGKKLCCLLGNRRHTRSVHLGIKR